MRGAEENKGVSGTQGGSSALGQRDDVYVKQTTGPDQRGDPADMCDNASVSVCREDVQLVRLFCKLTSIVQKNKKQKNKRLMQQDFILLPQQSPEPERASPPAAGLCSGPVVSICDMQCGTIESIRRS